MSSAALRAATVLKRGSTRSTLPARLHPARLIRAVSPTKQEDQAGKPQSGGPHSPEPGRRGTDGGWLRWLAPYIARNRKLLLLALLPVAFWTTAVVGGPLIQRIVVDDALVTHVRPLLPWLGLLVGVALCRAVFSAVWRWAGGRMSLEVQRDIRDDFYSHLQHLDSAAHEQMQSGALVARANSDLNLIQQAITLLPSVLGTILQVILAVSVMAVLSPPLALLLVVMLIVLMQLSRRMHMRVYAASWDGQQREAEMTTVAEEAVTGVRVVKGFGREATELDRFVDGLRTMFRARVRAIRQRAPLLGTLQVGPLFGQVLVLAVGGMLALAGHLTIGTFFAFLAYLADLTGAAKMLAMVLVLAPRARSGTERIAEIFEVEPEVRDTDYEAEDSSRARAGVAEPAQDPDRVDTVDRVTQPAVAGYRGEPADIVFDDVSFAYPDGQPVLTGFDLHVRPGETVALVGGTGSGKSTALQLIARLRDVTTGQVRVDGIDVADLPLIDLRDRVSMVFDEAMLSSGTVRENIRVGRPDATDAEVEHVARIAAIHDFIAGLDDGYDSIVGEQGLTLSGGQRQRIALARALLAPSDILVLDDATSAVDVKVERRILSAMHELVDDKTVLVVAYRESTLDLADRVVLIDGGQIVDQGTHAELLARSAHYRGLLSESPQTPDIDEATAGVTPSAWQPAQRSAGRARVGDPVSPQLAEALAKLPPAIDRTGVDTEHEANRRDKFALGQLVRPQRWGIALGLTLLLVDAFAGLSGPLLVQQGLEHALGSKSLAMLLMVCGLFALVATIDFAAVWACHFVTSRTTERVLYSLRVRMFAHLQRLGMDYYDRTHAGRIMTRLTADVDAVASLIQAGITNALVAIVTFGGMTVVLVVLNPTLALVVLSVLPFTVIATIWYRKVVRPAYEKARELSSALNTFLHETLAVLPVTHAFGRERSNQRHFDELAEAQLQVRNTSTRATSIYVGFLELLAALAVAGTLFVGSRLMSAGSLSIEQLLPFMLYLALAFAPVQQMASVFDIYQRASTGVRRIKLMLAEEESVPTPAEPQKLDGLAGAITLEGATLQYAGTTKPSLRGVDLNIEPGERVAFIGQTGAGKSTIAKVITRFYDVTDGQVKVDGVPLTDTDASQFRQQIGYVPQEPFLFSRTVRDNIAYGCPQATDAQVEAAARAVGAHEFIERLDGGYLHEVTERGKSLSAGQRQLLCMARALVLDPSVLVLDEATSHLDLASERRVEVAMRKVSAGRTTIVIAHRPQTLRWVDRVVTVHQGEVVADGPRLEEPAEELFGESDTPVSTPVGSAA